MKVELCAAAVGGCNHTHTCFCRHLAHTYLHTCAPSALLGNLQLVAGHESLCAWHPQSHVDE